MGGSYYMYVLVYWWHHQKKYKWSKALLFRPHRMRKKREWINRYETMSDFCYCQRTQCLGTVRQHLELLTSASLISLKNPHFFPENTWILYIFKNLWTWMLFIWTDTYYARLFSHSVIFSQFFGIHPYATVFKRCTCVFTPTECFLLYFLGKQKSSYQVLV